MPKRRSQRSYVVPSLLFFISVSVWAVDQSFLTPTDHRGTAVSVPADKLAAQDLSEETKEPVYKVAPLADDDDGEDDDDDNDDDDSDNDSPTSSSLVERVAN